MTPVIICFVMPQNQNKIFKQKSVEQKSFDDFNVAPWRGIHCVFVNVT